MDLLLSLVDSKVIFLAAAAIIAAFDFFRTRILDLSIGYWLVLFPWVYEDIVFGTDSWGAVLLWLIVVGIHAALPALFYRSFLDRKEYYTLFSFFVGLVLHGVVSFGLIPGHSQLISTKVSLQPAWSFVGIVSVLVITMLFARSRLASLSFFDETRGHIDNRTRLNVMLIRLATIMAYGLVGLFLVDAHKGLAGNAPSFALAIVVALVAIRPENLRGCFWVGALAGFLVIAANLIDVILSLELVTNSDFSKLTNLDSLSLVLLLLALIAMLRTPRAPALGSQEALIPPMLENPSRRAAFIAGLGYVVISAAIWQFGTISWFIQFSGLVVLGVSLSAIFILTRVMTILLPVLTYAIVLILIQLFSLLDLVAAIAMSALSFSVICYLFWRFVKSLQRLSITDAILYDLICAFALSQVLASIDLLSGSEGVLSVKGSASIHLTHSPILATIAVLSVASALASPAWVKHLKEQQPRSLEKRDWYAWLLSIPTYYVSQLHGFVRGAGSFIVVVIVSLFAVYGTACIVLISGRVVARTYAIDSLLIILAIGMLSAQRRSFVPSIGLAFSITLLLWMFAGFGQKILFFYGSLGIFVIVAQFVKKNAELEDRLPPVPGRRAST